MGKAGIGLFDFCLKKQLGSFFLDAALQSDARNIAVVGASGAGKTLTFNILAGLLAPDSGHIRINGQEWLAGKMMMPPQNRRIGLVFQDYALFPHLTVAQNVAFGLVGGLRNPSQKQSVMLVGGWLEKMGILHVAGHYPGQISGGQKQRAALTRALAREPGLLLLDEPFSALDAELRADIRKEVAVLAQELGMPLMLITHDGEDALALACEVWRMEQGVLRKEG